MKKYKIIWSPEFKIELTRIVDYMYFTLKEPQIARKFYRKILETLNTLRFFPEGYPKLYLRNQIYRKLPINKYLVIYEVDKDTRTSLYFTYIS